MKRTRVGILIFPDVEVLDFCGPFEVFSVARLDEAKRREEPSPFEVVLVAERSEPLTATGGLRVLPDHTLETCPPLDLLVVPGGWGTRREIKNPRLLDWIAARARQVETLTSVCTGCDAARPGGPARRTAGDHPLAIARLDARLLSRRDSRRCVPRGRRRQR